MDLLKAWIEQQEKKNLHPEQRKALQEIKLEHFYNNQNQTTMIQYEQQPYADIIEKFLNGKVDELDIKINWYGNIDCYFKWKNKKVDFITKFFPFDRSPIQIKVSTINLTEEETDELAELIQPLELELNHEWL